jgi:hypothetical protein
MKGPGSFPLERLLAIFRCIVVENVDSAHGFGQFGSSSHPNLNLEEAEGDGDVMEELSADVLMELSTVVSISSQLLSCDEMSSVSILVQIDIFDPL